MPESSLCSVFDSVVNGWLFKAAPKLLWLYWQKCVFVLRDFVSILSQHCDVCGGRGSKLPSSQ